MKEFRMQTFDAAQTTRTTASAPDGTLDHLLDRLEGPRPLRDVVATAADIERALGAVDGCVRAAYAPI
jgi:hypothetical protein